MEGLVLHDDVSAFPRWLPQAHTKVFVWRAKESDKCGV